MDIKDKKYYINNMFDKVFCNDNYRNKKTHDLNDEASYFDDHEVMDEFRDNNRSSEEY